MSTRHGSTSSAKEVNSKRSLSAGVVPVLPYRALTTTFPVKHPSKDFEICILCGEEAIPERHICLDCCTQIEKEQKMDLMNITKTPTKKIYE